MKFVRNISGRKFNIASMNKIVDINETFEVSDSIFFQHQLYLSEISMINEQTSYADACISEVFQHTLSVEEYKHITNSPFVTERLDNDSNTLSETKEITSKKAKK